MQKKELYIIGSGGLGREILSTFIHSDFVSKYQNIYFIDDSIGEINNISIIGNNKYLKNLNYDVDAIIAVSNCIVRERIINEFQNYKHVNFITFIHPKSSIYDIDRVQIGKGCYISENSILTTNIIIEDFCFINVNVSLHHDSIIRRNCFLMPGVRITGGAEIGENTYIGNNYQIHDKRFIQKNSILLNKYD